MKDVADSVARRNLGSYQTLKLEAVGLAADVPMLVGVDTLGVGKPDPRVFVEACRRLGTAPGRTVYVGDELDIDAQAASAAGLLGVWLDRPGPRRIEVSAEEIAAAGVATISSLSRNQSVSGHGAWKNSGSMLRSSVFWYWNWTPAGMNTQSPASAQRASPVS